MAQTTTVLPGDPLWNAALAVEATVFGEVFGQTQDDLRREYERFLPATTLVVTASEERVLCMARCMTMSPSLPLKTIEELRSGLFPCDEQMSPLLDDLVSGRRRAVEVLTLARAPVPGSGGHQVTACVDGIARLARADGAEALFGAMDTSVIAHFRTIYPSAVETFGPPVEYLGSPCQAIWVPVDGLLRSTS